MLSVLYKMLKFLSKRENIFLCQNTGKKHYLFFFFGGGRWGETHMTLCSRAGGCIDAVPGSFIKL